MFFSGEKVLTALISPMVPMEIKSSVPALGDSNFLAIYTTSRRLWTISGSRARLSPAEMRAITARSSALLRGGGSVSLPLM